jgi:tetratricopeptide (TPR) repeat protein
MTKTNKDYRRFVMKDENRRSGLDIALALRNSGDLEGACNKLSLLIEEFPDYPAPYVIKGGILLGLKLLDEAIWCFRRAVELRPRAELASRGLFHSLYDDGKDLLAFEEIRRFILSGGRSKVYDEIIAEAVDDVLTGNHAEPLQSKILEIYEIMKGKQGQIQKFPGADEDGTAFRKQ